jgi:hypothetical protein
MSYKEWKQKWNAEYNARPEVKEKKRLYAQRPENKLKEKLRKQKYNQRPEVKARNLARQNTPEAKEKKRLYSQKPEVKKRHKLSIEKYKEKNKDLVKAWAKAYSEKKKIDPEAIRKRKEYEKKRYQNPEYQRSKKEYVKNNISRIREYRKQYALKKKDSLAQKRKQRRLTDSHYKLKLALRSRLSNAVRRHQKCNSTLNLLGCDIDFLKRHLESQFKEGMSWDNWSTHGWHIDHIVPFGQFDLSDPIHQIAACNWRNLQPLWAKNNHSKLNKLTSKGSKLKSNLLSVAKEIYSKQCGLTIRSI